MADPDAALPAGDVTTWLADLTAALDGERDAVVPCGDCVACCTSAQFVHIAPDETDALAHIPPALLSPAPRLPMGHVVLGYDEHGRCPMLRDGRCSIYEHRPRTCRTYDCRVFALTGIEPDPAQPEIAARVRRWRFSEPTAADAAASAAVRAAATFLDAHPEVLPDGARLGPAQRAVLAVDVHRAFLEGDATRTPRAEEVSVELRRRR